MDSTHSVRGLFVMLSLLSATPACQADEPKPETSTPVQASPATSTSATDGPSLRARATMNIASATVMRVDGVAEAKPGPRLAGYLVRAGTEQAIPQPLLDELIALLRGPGFDDSVINRCRPGDSVGFRLLRAPGTPEQVVELVLDFGCNRLIIAGAGLGDAGHTTSFEPSRTAWLALIRRALPQDTALNALK